MKRPTRLPPEPPLPESRPAYPSLLDLALRSGRRAAVVGGAMAALAGAPGCDAAKSTEALLGDDLGESLLDNGLRDARDDAPYPELAGADVGSLPDVELDVPVAPEPELTGRDVAYIPDVPGLDVGPYPDVLPETMDEVAPPELAGVSDIGSSSEVGPVDVPPEDAVPVDVPPTSDPPLPPADAVLPPDSGV